MGPFKPHRRVHGPGGKEWELYVLRYRTPRWKPGDFDGFTDALMPGTLPVAFVSDLADALFHDVLVPLVRYPIDTAVALVQGSRSRKVWIEAICWDLPPYREMIVWRTTDEHYRRIVNEISFALQDGEIAEPLGAVREYKRGRIDES